MMDNPIQTIGFFEWYLGQKVNWDKSTISSVNIDDETLSLTVAWLKCKVGILPFIYLGLPPKKHSFSQPIIDKIHSKLERWKRHNLSRGGRLTLCNAVLSNLPTYCVSNF